MTSIFKILTLSVLFVFLAVTAQAQKSNVHVQYAINVEGSEEAAMVNGSTIDVYFAPDNGKMLINAMQGMIKMDLRMNTKKENGIMLLDMMGQQKYKVINKEDIKDVDKSKSESKGEMPEIKYLKEYKEIAGYKCQKALVMVEDKAPITVYFTEKLEMPESFQKYIEQLDVTGLKGFPMAIEMKDGESKFAVTAQTVDTSKQPKKIFEIKAPEGYEEITAEDLKGLGGMGGF